MLMTVVVAVLESANPAALDGLSSVVTSFSCVSHSLKLKKKKKNLHSKVINDLT